MGYILLLLAGICQGSFGLGYKKYTPLSWEVFWGIYNVLCMLIMAVWTLILVPDFGIIVASAEPIHIIIPILCGVVWGLSTPAFSKSVLLVGMSMCFGVNMGVSAAVGSIIPYFSGEKELSVSSLILFIISIIITTTYKEHA